MNRRLTAALLLVLGILAGLFAYTRFLSRNEAPQASVLLSFDPRRAVRAEVTTTDQLVVLEKRGDRWWIASPGTYPVDKALSTAMLTELSNLVSSGVISSNPAKAAQFDVDSAKGIKVSVFLEGEKQPHALVVGKLSPDFAHTYVRLDGRTEVYEAEGILRPTFERSVTAWRDRSVTEMDTESVNRLDLVGPNGNVHLLRENAVWRDAAPGKGARVPDAVFVAELVRELSHLRAQDFVDTPPAPFKPLLDVTVTPAGATPVHITVEAEQDGRYRIVVEGNPQRYLIPKSRLGEVVGHPGRVFTPAGKS